MNKENQKLNEPGKPEILLLPLTALAEDPLNYEAFSLCEIKELAEDMKKDGFFGEISAYPIENGKYRIESGHRRYRAALMAGFATIPVSITTPPSSMIERRLRLTQWNQHTRSFTPMDIAKLVSFTYDTLEMMKRQRQIEGSLITLTAEELGISTSNVSKYKMLLGLIEELQELAASGNYSWAHLAAASQLNEEAQHRLYLNIINEEKIHPITGTWLAREIEDYKHIRYFSSRQTKPRFDRASLFENISQRENSQQDLEIKQERTTKKTGKRKRRCDGTKGMRRAAALLQSSLSEEALVKDSELDEVIMLLHEMQEQIRMAEDRLRKRRGE